MSGWDDPTVVRECSVQGCVRLTRKGSKTSLCSRHAHRVSKYGDARGIPVDCRKLRLHVALARKALEHVRGRPALDTALIIAQDLLTERSQLS